VLPISKRIYRSTSIWEQRSTQQQKLVRISPKLLERSEAFIVFVVGAAVLCEKLDPKDGARLPDCSFN